MAHLIFGSQVWAPLDSGIHPVGCYKLTLSEFGFWNPTCYALGFQNPWNWFLESKWASTWIPESNLSSPKIQMLIKLDSIIQLENLKILSWFYKISVWFLWTLVPSSSPIASFQLKKICIFLFLLPFYFFLQAFGYGSFCFLGKTMFSQENIVWLLAFGYGSFRFLGKTMFSFPWIAIFLFPWAG